MGFADSYATMIQARILLQEAKDKQREADKLKEIEKFGEEVGLPPGTPKELITAIALEIGRNTEKYSEPNPMAQYALNDPRGGAFDAAPTRTRANILPDLPKEIADLFLGVTPLQRAEAVGHEAGAEANKAKASLDTSKANFLNTMPGASRPSPISQDAGVAAIQNRLRLGATPPTMGGLPSSPAGMFDMSDPRVLMALDIAGAPVPQMVDMAKQGRREESNPNVPGGKRIVTTSGLGTPIGFEEIPPPPGYGKTQQPYMLPDGTVIQVPADMDTMTLAQDVPGVGKKGDPIISNRPNAGKTEKREVTNLDGSVDEVRYLPGPNGGEVVSTTRIKPPSTKMPLGQESSKLAFPDGSIVPPDMSAEEAAKKGARAKDPLSVDGKQKFSFAMQGLDYLKAFEQSGMMDKGLVDFGIEEAKVYGGFGGPMTSWWQAAEFAIRLKSGAAIRDEEVASQARMQYPMNSRMSPEARRKSFNDLSSLYETTLKVYDPQGVTRKEMGGQPQRYEYVPGKGLVPK